MVEKKNELTGFILCPKCKKRIVLERILTNATVEGQVKMSCPACATLLGFTLKGDTLRLLQEQYAEQWQVSSSQELAGYLQVVENSFGPSALLPITFGTHILGRYNGRSTTATLPVLTQDPSMDRNHTNVIAKEDEGSIILIDNDSMTGTFVNGVELAPQEEYALKAGDTLTLGATSLIFIPIE